MGAYWASACAKARALPACVQEQSVNWMSGLCGKMQIHFFFPVSLIEAVLLKKNGCASGKTMPAVTALLRNAEAVGSSMWESLKYRQGPNCHVFSSTCACIAGYIRKSLKACCKHENSANQQGAQEERCFYNKSPYSLSVCHKGFLGTYT